MIRVEPSSEACGASVTGIDLTKPLDPGDVSAIRAAWLKHVAADGQSGAVLHHAAVFFEWSDPLLAEELLERAIRVEPREPLHVERLGALYGR